MPDADDFDVECFRNLLKRNLPQDGTQPAAPPQTAVKKNKRPPDQANTVKATSTSKVARKKDYKG